MRAKTGISSYSEYDADSIPPVEATCGLGATDMLTTASLDLSVLLQLMAVSLSGLSHPLRRMHEYQDRLIRLATADAAGLAGQLIKHADAALCRAKAAGRDRLSQ